MKVYSPSATARFSRCPLLWALDRNGWHPRVLSKRDLYAIGGRAIASGVGAYNLMTQAGDTSAIEIRFKRAADVMSTIFHQGIEELEASQRQLPNTAIVSEADEILENAKRMLGAYTAKNPTQHYHIVGVELELGPEAGNARPDLVVEDKAGDLLVIDYKSRWTTRTGAQSGYWENIDRLERSVSHQLLHYAYFVGQKYGRPVKHVGICELHGTRGYTPFITPDAVSHETLAIWYESAKGMWEVMERIEKEGVAPWMATQHADRYGLCEMYNACFRHHLDPTLMSHEYVQLERVKESV